MLADLPIGEPVPYRQGSLGEDLDLHAALIPNPVCTFYMRVSGNGMRQHGINDGDLMVIDRSVEPCSGHVVVVAHQGSFLLRPLLRQGSSGYLSQCGQERQQFLWTWRSLIAQGYLAWWCMRCITWSEQPYGEGEITLPVSLLMGETSSLSTRLPSISTTSKR